MEKHYFTNRKDFRDQFSEWSNKAFISLDTFYNKEVFTDYMERHKRSLNRTLDSWRGLFFQKCLNYLIEGIKMPLLEHEEERVLFNEANDLYHLLFSRHNWKLIERDYVIVSWRWAKSIDYIFYNSFSDQIILISLKKSPYVRENKDRRNNGMVSSAKWCLGAMKEHFKEEYKKMVFYTLTVNQGVYRLWTWEEMEKFLDGKKWRRW